MALRHGTTYAVTFQIATMKGKPPETFTVQPDIRSVPHTANSFLFLACAGYYTGSSLDRVIAGRLVEGGSPPSPPGPGYGFLREAVHGSYGRGTVAMVDDGSPTDGGRFFIPLDRMTLPPLYVILGTVSAGLSALDRVARTPVGLQPDAQERTAPLERLRISAVRVVAH
jgi:cyclophilin family peptidyl-prolyl cis-trans isomerase